MNKIRRIKSLVLLCSFFFICFIHFEARAMTQILSDRFSLPAEGFSVTRLGGHGFGSNSIRVLLSGFMRSGLSDTIDRDISGVGIFDFRLSSEGLNEAREIQSQLCAQITSGPRIEIEPIQPATLFSVYCFQDGKLTRHTGKTYELSKDLSYRLDRYFLKMRDVAAIEGTRIVKLDVRVDSFASKNRNFIASVEFLNSGEHPIELIPPSQWQKEAGDRLNIGGVSNNGNAVDVDLVGATWANKDDFPDNELVIQSHSKISLTFLVDVSQKIPAGDYAFNVLASIDIGAGDVSPSLGKVNFHSDRTRPTRITFDRDYPSTPEEWRDFEARKAKEVSFLMPGNTVTEPGYYRAASISGRRDQFVTKFEQGTAAPKLDFQLWDRWEWEADLARATTCKPGDACPREGRWILRAKEYAYSGTREQTYSQHERRFKTGESMPEIGIDGVNGSSLFWQWLRNA